VQPEVSFANTSFAAKTKQAKLNKKKDTVMKTKNNRITLISLCSGVAVALAVAAWLPGLAAEKTAQEANDNTRSVDWGFSQ
jgi:hypothetical protein